MRKRKQLIFGDQQSINRAQCSQRLPHGVLITMIAEVEASLTDSGKTQVSGIIPVKDEDFDNIYKKLADHWGREATVYERDPLGFAPYTDIVYTDDYPREFYLIQAVY